MDATVMSFVRRQRGSSPASCARLQSRQLSAHAGDARADQGLVADEPEGKADQDWREGRQPGPLCRLPDGRGRHSEKPVHRHPAAGRRTTATAHYIHSVRRSIVMRSMQSVGKVRLDDGKRNIFRRSARSRPPRRPSTNRGGASGLPETANRCRFGLEQGLSGECRFRWPRKYRQRSGVRRASWRTARSTAVTAARAWWWPQMAAPVFAGTTRLSGNVFFGYNSAIAIPGVELTAAAARLDVTGGLSAAQIADIRISAKTVPNAESRTALKDAEIRRLGFNAHVTGALDSPTIDSTLEVEDARLPSASLSHLDASFKAAPTGSIANASTLLQLAADAKVRGLSLANPALAQAVGSEASFAMRGASTLKGLVDFHAT